MALFDNNADQLVNTAEEIAYKLANGKVKAHQMRRIFEQVQYIHDKVFHSGFTKVQRDLKLLKPQLAYAVHRKPELSPLHEEFSRLVDRISDKEDVQEFYDFLMAVMCYHKYYYKEQS